VQQGLPVVGDAGEGFAAELPPFSRASGVAAGAWEVNVPSRHTPPELQVPQTLRLRRATTQRLDYCRFAVCDGFLA